MNLYPYLLKDRWKRDDVKTDRRRTTVTPRRDWDDRFARTIDETTKHSKRTRDIKTERRWKQKIGIRIKRQKIRRPEGRRPPFRVLPLDWVD